MQRSAHIVVPGALAALAAAEWLRAGDAGWPWAAIAGAGGLAAVATALRGERKSAGPREPLWRRAPAWGGALAAFALGVTLVAGSVAVHRVECCWPALRERRVMRASAELASELSASVSEARRLADRGAVAGLLPRETAFDLLGDAVHRTGVHVERGVVVLSRDGDPWAWAGRHRFVPAIDSAELRAVITPFYVSLEARRQTQTGGEAIGSVLLDATAVPDRAGAMSAAFGQAHGVALRFYPPHLAPAGPDVFDYKTPQGDTLLSVQAVPPSQGDARLAILGTSVQVAGLLLAATLVVLLLAAAPGRWRWGVALVGAWCLLRAPLGPSGRLAAFFSPVTFYRPMLGLFSSSAGALTLFAALVLFAAGAVWRHGVRRRWWSVPLAAALTIAAPYLVRNFARGITPPAGGASIALWLSWELTLAVASMALIMIAAALVRGTDEPRGLPWILPAACGWALLVALAGLWLWEPNDAWPEWYTFLWLPALGGVLVPARRRWSVVAVAIVAGTAAALVTWGAAIEGRVALADRDARGLGRESDPLAAALLERLSARVSAGPPPETAGDLYGLWLASPLARQGYPTVLSLWTENGDPDTELSLATLDLPAPLIAALVRSPATRQGPRVERIEAVPGVHYVLIAPLIRGGLRPPGEVLAVAVGPRSRLVPPSRVARFLQGELAATSPYVISLSPPAASVTPLARQVVWTREGWFARGERRLNLPGGVRHAHLRVDLRGPWPLCVRGLLVVLLDVLFLAGLWLLGIVMEEGWTVELPRIRVALRTSYRVRLTAALAGFVVIPVFAFAIWSFARVREEARSTRDLLIRQTLKDAAITAGELPADRPDAVQRAIGELGTRLDADLWLYRDGLLIGTSTPVLDELGLIDRYLFPAVFETLGVEDELEGAANGRTAGRSIRIGYRVVAAGSPSSEVILAAPQLLDDESVRQQEEDLALSLMLAICVGVAAAAYLAGLAARALARPVAVLRRAAIAVGGGTPIPAFPEAALREFEPVMTAFQRMATDVQSSQAALEEARRRTARVLANVATGVIAVDRSARVTLANARAADLIGVPLAPGDLVEERAGEEWQGVWAVVRTFLAAPGGGGIVEREFTLGQRQIRVQIAALGGEDHPDGAVVALDDATDMTRAARVLAWGEMARQVAHEIKNPLTPIRLGIQHLQRIRKHENFDATLQETASRIIAEIDRLDAIARTFSRFGSPAGAGFGPGEAAPLEQVDLHGLAQEVVQLYALGGVGGATRFQLAGAKGEPVLARRDEVKEVLVNLLENARNAGAQRVTVRVAREGRELSVADDGHGIAPDVLPRVFEPAFSTTSSGAGLGLAIAKRLVDSWGGSIGITSNLGVGTTVTMTLLTPKEAPSQSAA